jgi:hypothetical protein
VIEAKDVMDGRELMEIAPRTCTPLDVWLVERDTIDEDGNTQEGHDEDLTDGSKTKAEIEFIST